MWRLKKTRNTFFALEFLPRRNNIDIPLPKNIFDGSNVYRNIVNQKQMRQVEQAETQYQLLSGDDYQCIIYSFWNQDCISYNFDIVSAL